MQGTSIGTAYNKTRDHSPFPPRFSHLGWKVRSRQQSNTTLQTNYHTIRRIDCLRLHSYDQFMQGINGFDLGRYGDS